jgi:hypothetical protein
MPSSPSGYASKHTRHPRVLLTQYRIMKATCSTWVFPVFSTQQTKAPCFNKEQQFPLRINITALCFVTLKRCTGAAGWVRLRPERSFPCRHTAVNWTSALHAATLLTKCQVSASGVQVCSFRSPYCGSQWVMRLPSLDDLRAHPR